MTTNENLLATVEALKHVNPRRWDPIPYQNRRGIWGISFRFWYADQWHFISVHNCQTYLEPLQLARLISGIQLIEECRWGVYANQEEVPGFYATALSTVALDGSFDHWFMIGRSREKHFSSLLRCKQNLSEEETDLLDYLERKYPQALIHVKPICERQAGIPI